MNAKGFGYIYFILGCLLFNSAYNVVHRSITNTILLFIKKRKNDKRYEFYLSAVYF